MVCKEDVLLWFKDLESYKRIDVMYELLNMCIPFEVRFLGSCIEEMGKHTYHELRGPSIIANDVERLSKDPHLHLGLLDEKTRHRAVIYMSVLSARNCSCANWFYRTLFRTDTLENYVNGVTKDDNTLSELLLLFTLGIYHPAFTFEQKTHFGKLLDKLIAPSEGNKFTSAQNVMHGPVSSPRTLSSHQNVIPVKTTAPLVASGDTSTLHPPPGLPPPSHQHPIDFFQTAIVTGRTDIRPAFQPTVVGAPDMHPFPAQPVSPLMSQTGSPPLSRATSPPRSFNMRPLPTNTLQLSGAIIPPIPPEDLSTAPFEVPLPPTPNLPFNSEPEIVSIKSNEDDSNHISDDKMREHQWLSSPMYDPIKQMNGVRPSFTFLTDQIQVLKLEAENSLHCSNSTSSNNSNNQSPTETPSITPSVTPHGPGRGGTDSKTRMNGIPHQFIFDSAQMPPFSTVPYTMSHVHPSRYFTTPFRAPFPYPYQQNDVYTLPPYSVIYSSNPPQPSRNPNCFNCGGMGHSGNDCNGHTVEDITQKPYILDYTTIPDNPDN